MENQNQVSRRRPRALGNRSRDFHIPAAPATTAMGKWKSKSRIPTFPQRLLVPIKQIKNERRSTPAQNLVLQAHLRIGMCCGQWVRSFRPESGVRLIPEDTM